MKADSLVILGAAAALFLLGVLGFMITEIQTEREQDPDGAPGDYIEIQVEARPFLKVGVSSIVFGIVILLIFALAVGVSKARRG